MLDQSLGVDNMITGDAQTGRLRSTHGIIDDIKSTRLMYGFGPVNWGGGGGKNVSLFWGAFFVKFLGFFL